MKVYFSSLFPGVVSGIALVTTALLTLVAIQLPSEVAPRSQGLLIAGCGILFAVLLAGAIGSLKQERRRRSTEASLRISEGRAGTVLETAVDAIITIDERGTIEAFNRAAERLLGYSATEARGQNVNILMPSPEREAHDGYMARYRETGERKIIGIGREVVCRRKDGTEFPADLAVGEYRDGGQRKFTGFIRDISERKRAEAQIREQAALLDKTREAILLRGLDDRIIYWNKGAERLFGWSAEEACGKTCLDLFFRGDPSELEKGKRAVLGGDEWVGEMRKLTRDGREVVVESRWSLLRDSFNRPTEILAIESDITEKKERERHALRAQRLESIGTLAGGIAHDLNNMLTPIMMSANLLQKDRPHLDRDSLLSNIRASAERGAEMVKQLLSFAGGTETERTRVDLREVVDEIKSLLDHTLPKSISIRTELAEGLWPVAGNATQLSQVLMNLCVNARDAMPDGGTLTLAGSNVVVDDEFAATAPDASPGPHVRLAVEDTGCGIPADVLDRVFDPFFTTKEQGKGTGLGLSTVLGIVRGHHGLVRVDSKPGQGTTFEIYIPAFEAVPVEKPSSNRQETVSTAGQLILVIDDESLILVAVKATLEDAGYRVLTAGSGDEGLAILRERGEEVNAAIVDMMMPGMDGPMTMRALREISPRLRIIANSGLKVEVDTERLAGAFLSKPYTDAQLLTTVSNVLNDVR